MASLLLQLGADAEVADKDGWTALHLASDCGEGPEHERVIRLLVKRGARIEAKDKNGETPLHRACTKGLPKVVKLFLDLNASKCLLCELAKLIVVIDLSLRIDIKETDNYGWSPLHIAAAKGHDEVITVLVNGGSDREQIDQKGWTPLLVATACGTGKAVKALLVAGVNANAVGGDDSTALAIAASRGNLELVKLLVDAGAELEVQVRWTALTNQWPVLVCCIRVFHA